MSKISWWRTSFGPEEVERLKSSVSLEHISEGVVTREFEEAFAQLLGVPYAVATPSGSAALLLSLMALGIGPGDEVIVPDRTWIATAHAVLMTGATVILADVRPDIPVMDVSKLAPKITNRTKAIIPVHLNGRGTEMAEIQSLTLGQDIAIIEDACQAMCSRNLTGFLGTQSKAGCFSLSVSKLISTGQGGMVVTRDEEFYRRLKLTKNHGVVDVFTDTWNQMGFNFKYTDLLASFGLVQMSRIPERIEHMKNIYSRYKECLEDIPFVQLIPVDLTVGELPLYAEVRCNQRDRVVSFLNQRGIQVRPVPPNIDISPYISHGGRDNFPNSERFSRESFYLPSGPAQPLGNIEFVIQNLKEFHPAP